MKKYMKEILQAPLFESISKEDLPVMLDCMGAKVKRFHRGEIIFLMNDKVRYIGVVLQGCVHMVKENIQGDQTLLSIIRPGDVMGESFACGDEEIAYTTFVASENSVILGIPFQKILHTCNNQCEFHHSMIGNMVTMLANKNVRLMEKIDVSSQKTLREKILTYLRIEAQKQGSNSVELKMNRTVLADFLGANRSALTRELSLMREEGILDFERNHFILKRI